MTTELSNRELIDGIREGNTQVLEYLYRRYHSRMLKNICSWGESPENAEDIFQDALTAIFINSQQDHFDIYCSFFTYLYSVSRRTWLNKKRREKRLPQVSFEQDLLLKLDQSAVDDTDLAEQFILIMEKLKKLPNDCQTILTESILEGKSSNEIMILLNTSSKNYLYKRRSICLDILEKLVFEQLKI